MTQRISKISPPGSLLKTERVPHKPRSKRTEEAPHLVSIRMCPCLACDKDPCGEAAHVRMAAIHLGKPEPGIGRKPDDRWTVPLCHQCHMHQHVVGEKPFWTALGLDPLAICAELYATKGDRLLMRMTAMRIKGGRK